MTYKQELFIQEYIKTGNATASAIKAGYKEKYAGVNADKLLKNTNIKKYIEELSQKVANNNIMTAKERQEYLTKIN